MLAGCKRNYGILMVHPLFKDRRESLPVLEKFRNTIRFYKIDLILFIVSFGYICYFTLGVGFFWEDPFILNYPERWTEIIQEIFTFGTSNFYDAGAPLYRAYTLLSYNLFGIDYDGFRVMRALFFALTVAILFRCLINTLHQFPQLRRYAKALAGAITLLVLTSYPYFLVILQIPRTQYVSLPFKILGIYFFFKLCNEKNFHLKWIQIFGLGTLFFLTIKGHPASVSVIFVLMGFILFVNARKLFDIKILLLFLFIISINFPITLFNFELPVHDAYVFKPEIIYRYLNVLPVLTFPFMDLQDLYYKSFFEIVTLPGLLAGSILVFFFILKIFQKGVSLQKTPLKAFLILNILWFFSELFTLFNTPDHATRYLLMMMVPFYILLAVSCVLLVTQIDSQRTKRCFFYICVGIILWICIVNVFYTYLFRTTWGSSFIAIAKTSEYFSSINRTSSVALYSSGSVATEYYILTVPFDYNNSIQETVSFFQIVGYEQFDPHALETLKSRYTRLFILKRISSTGRSTYPERVFEEDEGFKEIAVFEGVSDSFFDSVTWWLTRILSIPVYPSKVVLYEYIGMNYSS